MWMGTSWTVQKVNNLAMAAHTWKILYRLIEDKVIKIELYYNSIHARRFLLYPMNHG